MICIAGKNNIAIDVCTYIISKYGKENVCVMLNKNDEGENSFQNSFKQFSENNQLKKVSLEDIYSINNLHFFSMEFDKIVNPNLFVTKNLYNIHFSLLPKYKGMYTSALPILYNESETGVTFHKIDKGIDTGDVIIQEKICLSKTETAKNLYLKYINIGTRLVIDNIDSVILGNYNTTPQLAIGSTYFSKKSIDYSNVEINLLATAHQIDLQLRAFSFRDFQMPIILGHSILKANILSQKSDIKAGTLLSENKDTLVLSTIDYNIELIKDRFDEVLKLCQEDNIEELLKINNIELYIDEQNKKGWTPIIVAIYNNSKRVFNYLVSKGSNLNITNYNGTSLLMYAKDASINCNDDEIFCFLLTQDLNRDHKDVYGKDIFHYTKTQSTRLYNKIRR